MLVTSSPSPHLPHLTSLTIVLSVLAAMGFAQWCLVDPQNRTDCLFTDESNCTAFGCCWAGSALRPQCYDPENGCVGPAITTARATQLFGGAAAVSVGGAGLRATSRDCSSNSYNCSSPWVDADSTVQLQFGSQLCLASNCPSLEFVLFNRTSRVYAGLVVAETLFCGDSNGLLDFKTGLIAPFNICHNNVKLPDGQVVVIDRGYSTDDCAHFTSRIYEFGSLQLSFSLRVAF